MNNIKLGYDIILKIAVIMIAMLSPFAYFYIANEQPSISTYWLTPAQPIFVIVNATTSYFLFSVDRWKISAILLMLLTAFSVQYYQPIHNVFAVLFFLVNLYPLLYTKRFRIFSVFYALSAFFFIFGLLWGEIAAITVVCLYHLTILIYTINLINHRKK